MLTLDSATVNSTGDHRSWVVTFKLKALSHSTIFQSSDLGGDQFILVEHSNLSAGKRGNCSLSNGIIRRDDLLCLLPDQRQIKKREASPFFLKGVFER
jgi:hypothetical protein